MQMSLYTVISLHRESENMNTKIRLKLLFSSHSGSGLYHVIIDVKYIVYKTFVFMTGRTVAFNVVGSGNVYIRVLKCNDPLSVYQSPLFSVLSKEPDHVLFIREKVVII